MTTESRGIWRGIERAKLVIEGLAIIVAGLWALKLYRETEWPAQEKRPSIQSDLQWTNKSADNCIAEYTATFKNVGKTSIDLDRVQLHVWSVRRQAPTQDVEYFDPQEVMKNKSVLDRTLTNNEFASHYPPDVGDTVTSNVFVKRNPGQVVLFKYGFKQKDFKEDSWIDYRWGYACDEPSVEAAKKPSLNIEKQQNH
jgi:hypothetical protein